MQKTNVITFRLTAEQLKKLIGIKKENKQETLPQTLRYLIENFKGK